MNASKHPVASSTKDPDKVLKIFERRSPRDQYANELRNALRKDPQSYTLPKDSGLLWLVTGNSKGRFVKRNEWINAKNRLRPKLADDNDVKLLGTSIVPTAPIPEVESLEAASSAFGEHIRSYELQMARNRRGLTALNKIKRFHPRLRAALEDHPSVRFFVSVKARYHKEIAGVKADWEDRLGQSKWISAPAQTAHRTTAGHGGGAYKQLTETLRYIRSTIEDKILKSSTDDEGSGLVFDQIDGISLNIIKHNPVRGGTWLDTSKIFNAMHGVINVNNSGGPRCKCWQCDDATQCIHCFQHAVCAVLHPKPDRSDKNRMPQYREEVGKYNWDGINFPATVDDIATFETNNPDFGITLLQCKTKEDDLTKLDEDNVYVARACPWADNRRVIWLMLINDHFVGLTKPQSLLQRQVNKVNKATAAICPHCFHTFYKHRQTSTSSVSILRINYTEPAKLSECSDFTLDRAEMLFKTGTNVWPADLKKLPANITEVFVPALQGQTAEVQLNKHLENRCVAEDGDVPSSLVSVPALPKVMQFEHWAAQVKTPWFIVADFESTLVPSTKEGIINHHIANSYFMYAVCSEDLGPEVDWTKLRMLHRPTDTSDKVIAQFVIDVCEMRDYIKELNLRHDKPKWTAKQKRERDVATECYLCKCALQDKRVIEHCHLTGKIRGIACVKCNANLRVTGRGYQIPVLFHNLKGYDSHLILEQAHRYINQDDPEAFGGVQEGGSPRRDKFKKQLQKFKSTLTDNPDEPEEVKLKKSSERLTALCQNSEKILTMSFQGIKFLDSMGYLTTSLDKLVENLKGKEDIAREGDPTVNLFQHTRSYLGQRYPECNTDLLLRKGVYPYEYVKDIKVLEDKELPAQEDFYSAVSGSGISDKDYAHAQQVWQEFGCASLGEYHDLYLMLDVCLTADVLVQFRSTAYSAWGIDPFYRSFISLPGYSWACMLKYTGEQIPGFCIELLHGEDTDKYLFFEEMIRGGVSYIGTRHATANNKHLDNHDPKKPTTCIQYLDANNLYSVAQSFPMPYKDIEWVPQETVDGIELTLEDIKAMNGGKESCPMVRDLPTDEGDSTGYIFEVDLDVPPHLHDKFNDFPMAVEKRVVKEEEMSPLQDRMLDGGKMTKTEKLIPSLSSKKRYKVHGRNLQFYLEQGLVLTKIHRMMQFTQRDFLRPYVIKNTEFRTAATSDFEKDFYKLALNAVFGKSQENVRKYCDYRLLSTPKMLQNAGNNPYLRFPFKIYSDNLVGVTIAPKRVMLSKPVFIGASILEISKLWMYKFWYEYLQPRYGVENVKLLFTDTDSACVQIKSEDVFADMADAEGEPWFDRSNFKNDSPYFSSARKKELGMFKDETGGDAVKEVVGLRPKMYSVITMSGDHKSVAKGVPVKVKKTIPHEDYLRVLHGIESGSDVVYFTSIKSSKHQLTTRSMQKVGLSRYDNKSYICMDGIQTLRHGHHRIPAIQTTEREVARLVDSLVESTVNTLQSGGD